MKHLSSVSAKDANTSHWSVKTDGTTLEWDAKTLEERENEMIAWESLPGGDVDNAGSVWFRPAFADRGKVVKVAVKYAPTGGKLAAKVARAFGKDAKSVIEDDLYRLKSLLETGEMPATEGQPRDLSWARTSNRPLSCIKSFLDWFHRCLPWLMVCFQTRWTARVKSKWDLKVNRAGHRRL